LNSALPRYRQVDISEESHSMRAEKALNEAPEKTIPGRWLLFLARMFENFGINPRRDEQYYRAIFSRVMILRTAFAPGGRKLENLRTRKL